MRRENSWRCACGCLCDWWGGWGAVEKDRWEGRGGGGMLDCWMLGGRVSEVVGGDGGL